MNGSLLVLLSALCLNAHASGPVKQQPSPKQTSSSPETTSDPVADFKAIVAAGSSAKSEPSTRQNSQTQKWTKSTYELGQVKYDVTKTDSLISPLKGVVSFPVTSQITVPFDSREEAEAATTFTGQPLTIFVTGEYVFVDRTWKLDHFSYRVNFKDPEASRDISTITRDQLQANLQAPKGIGVVLRNWFR